MAFPVAAAEANDEYLYCSRVVLFVYVCLARARQRSALTCPCCVCVQPCFTVIRVLCVVSVHLKARFTLVYFCEFSLTYIIYRIIYLVSFVNIFFIICNILCQKIYFLKVERYFLIFFSWTNLLINYEFRNYNASTRWKINVYQNFKTIGWVVKT